MGQMRLYGGIDIGSKTIKGVIFAASGTGFNCSPTMIYSSYRPHNTRTAESLELLLEEMQDAVEGRPCAVALTGSGAIGLAEKAETRFVQEVVATKRSLELLAPQANAVIELGGEDAKVLYLTHPAQQRMNTSCAGGTGSYLEDVAALLGVSMRELDELAGKGVARYQIASRCAVFALRDLKPLLASGAQAADLAASVYTAVVDQTLATLCAGRRLTGKVAFLGGPMAHLPHLVEAFGHALELSAEDAVVPENAQLAAAIGAALCAMEDAANQDGSDPKESEGAFMRCHSERSECKRAESKNLAGEKAGSLVRAPLHTRQLDSSTTAATPPSLRMTEPEKGATEVSQLRAREAEIPLRPMTSEPPSLRMTEPEGPDIQRHAMLAEFAERAASAPLDAGELPRLAPLRHRDATMPATGDRIESGPYVEGDEKSNHSDMCMPEVSIAEAALPLFAGVDAGSTTVKMAVVDSEGRLVFSRYNANPKNGTQAAQTMWHEFESECTDADIDATVAVKRIAACGYGEDMLATMLGAQDIVAETTAHCRGALEVFPQASFILDIGGQDMKALWIKDGELTDTALNETCSSGCGAFMSSAAAILGMTLAQLDQAALAAQHPVELGARCTVFMRSRVRAAQEQQIDVADIAAGAAYSVASNACRRLIGPRRIGTLGDFVVVQGGAFASDAVLAAFEAELGRKVHRCEQGPLMGAIGAALVARDNARLAEQQTATAAGSTCPQDGEFDEAPNVVAYQQELLASYHGFTANGGRGAARIGLVCALGDYEALPFWYAALRELGFSVVVPGDCTTQIAPSTIAATLPSDMVCMPARLMHKRVLELVAAGATCILCPSSDEAGTCPVTREYQDVLPAAMLSVTDVSIVVPKLGNFSPRAMNRELVDPEPLRSCLEELLPPGDHLSTSELEHAVRVGQAEYRAFVARVQGATQDALDWIHANPLRHGIVISGRSYHTDPELLGGIDRIVHEQGFAVIPPMGIGRQAREARRPFIDHTLDRRRTWIPAKHVLGYAALSVCDPQLDTIFLQSFGCGMDAVSHVDVERMLGQHSKPFTLVKLDSKADPKHTRLRVRALAEAIASRRRYELTSEREATQQDKQRIERAGRPTIGIAIAREFDDAIPKLPFAGLKPEDARYAQEELPSDMCSTAALLAAYAIRQAEAHPGMTIEVPYVCEECILQSVQHFVTLTGYDNLVSWVSDWPSIEAAEKLGALLEEQEHDSMSRKRIGLVGNPLMLFDPVANQGLVEFIREQGVEVALPELSSWYSDVAHYLPQLESLEAQGVEHVLMVQSFLCLKTHVYVRGALPQLEARFPQMTFHVIDIDPQGSALNVRNRVLLALEEL